MPVAVVVAVAFRVWGFWTPIDNSENRKYCGHRACACGLLHSGLLNSNKKLRKTKILRPPCASRVNSLENVVGAAARIHLGLVGSRVQVDLPLPVVLQNIVEHLLFVEQRNIYGHDPDTNEKGRAILVCVGIFVQLFCFFFVCAAGVVLSFCWYD